MSHITLGKSLHVTGEKVQHQPKLCNYRIFDTTKIMWHGKKTKFYLDYCFTHGCKKCVFYQSSKNWCCLKILWPQISLIWIKFFPGGLCLVKKYRGLNIFAKAPLWLPVHSDKPRTSSAPPILCPGKIWLKRKQIQNPSPGVAPAIMPKSSQAKRPQAHEWNLSSLWVLEPILGLW